jgi:gliding motility associated protien GldN
MKKIMAVAAMFITLHIQAQDDTHLLPWEQRDRTNVEPLPYQYQREADVAWSKTIWRVIDVRQKMNLPFAYEQKPLIEILHEAAKHGEITVYDPAIVNADQFKKKMDTAEVQIIGEINDSSFVLDVENPDSEYLQVIHEPLHWDRITKYRIKEVWFIDTRTSTMQVRIMAIAPVMEYYDNNGTYVGDMTMYWIYYPSLRNMLAKQEVFNAQNESQHYSWEDLFEMRKFESYITKESNVFDRNIQEYATGIDAQLESERIKQELFEKEHDMWNY